MRALIWQLDAFEASARRAASFNVEQAARAAAAALTEGERILIG